MKTVLKFIFVLFLVNFVAAAILAAVYGLTKGRIEAQERLVEDEALKQVMPEGVGDRIELVQDGGDIKYWKVFKGDRTRPTGYIFIAKKYGYSSVIETMVGIKRDGTITGVSILSQNETPGLGAKIVEVASTKTVFSALKGLFSSEVTKEKELEPYFTEQLKGLSVRKLALSKNVEAITGATISSAACVEAIREQGLEILRRD